MSITRYVDNILRQVNNTELMKEYDAPLSREYEARKLKITPSHEALRASMAEVDIPYDFVEQVVNWMKDTQKPAHLRDIIMFVFRVPGVGQYSFAEIRSTLNKACEQGQLINLPHGHYTTTGSQQLENIHHLKQMDSF